MLQVNEYSILLQWQGSNPALRPVVFISHTDVVPAGGPAAEASWQHGPFSGAVSDG